MKVHIVACEEETGKQLVEAVRAASFEVSAGSAECEVPPGSDALVLDGFAGPELGAIVGTLLPSAQVLVLAGVPLDHEVLDHGIEAGIDGFYPAGLPRSLVFQLTSWARRAARTRESEAAGRRIEQANDVIYTVDFEGNFTSANAAAERLTGYPREQLIGMNMKSLLLPEHLEVAEAAIRAKLGGNQDSSFFEVQIRHADGRMRWVEISSQLLVEDGRPVAIQGIARDLSERRKLEEEVVFRAELLESMQMAAFAVDLRGDVLFWNNAAVELFGISKEEAAAGDVVRRILGAEMAAAARAILRQEGGPGSHANEVNLFRADGSGFPAHLSSSPLRDGAGKVAGALAVCLDLTERRRQEDQIRLLATIVESAAVGALARDLDGRVISWNPAAERLFGYTATEAIGRRMTGLVPPELLEGVPGQFASVKAGENFEVEVLRLHKDGTPIPVRMTSFPLRDQAGEVAGTATLFYDLRGEQASEQALRQSEERYRAAAELSNDGLFMLEAVRDAAGVMQDLRFVDMNTAGERLMTLRRDEVMGHGLREVFPPDGAGFFEHFRVVVETGEPWEAEVELDIPKVTARWLHQSVVRLGDGIAVTSRDITERHARQAELDEARSQLRAIFESTTEAVIVVDRDLRVITSNEAALGMSRVIFGSAPAPGEHMSGWVHESDWRHFESNCERGFAGERVTVCWRVRTLEQGELWFEYNFNPVRGEGGEIYAVAMMARDISVARAMERALREATEHHRSVVENTSDGIFVLEVEGSGASRRFRIGMFNSAFCQLTGLDGEASAGKYVEEILPASSVSFARGQYLAAIEAGGTISYEEVVPFGGRPHVQTRMTPIFDAEGRCYRIIGSSRDITEQVRLTAEERAAREKAERLALIVESANDAIIGLDMDRRVVSWSPGAVRMYGYSAEEALGRPVDFFYPDDMVRELAFSRLDAVYAGERFTDSATRRRHKSGRVLDVLVSAFPLRDSDGAIVGVGSTATDITGQREAEEALLNKAADLNAVFGSAREQLFLLDADGRILSANRAAIDGTLAIWGRDVSGGGDMREFVPPDEPQRFEDNLARALGGESFEFERTVTFPSGVLTLEVSFTPVRRDDGGVRGVLLGVRDVSERKRTTEALMQAQKLESLAVLAGGIAHDFNNLLVGILGNAGLALSELPANAPARETIESIEVAGQRAAELARQMLAYSGKGKFLIQDVDLSTLVEEMTHLLRVSLGKQVSLQLQVARGLPAVQADATQLRQVIMNLVVNASDAIGEAEGVISIRTSLVEATSALLAESHLAPDLPPGPYVCVEVTDTGAGMDSETKARVFDPFFTTKFTGRGLGLAAALGIMRGHRGAIKVESKPGEGTTFRLLLPALATASASGNAVVESAQWRGSGTVLVVDDEPTVRAVTARALQAFGFEVIEAEDGVEGVEAFRANAADIACILLDMTMPRMNGEETYEAIMAMDPEARVILMSGYSEQDAIDRFAGRRLAGFVQKPYELSTLRAALQEALEQ